MFCNIKGRLVNIDKVSNVNLNNEDRVIFNFAHGIEFEKGTVNADYLYIDFNSRIEAQKEKDVLLKTLLENGFIKSNYKHHNVVNLKNVAYINYHKEKNRIIFNFSVSVTKQNTGCLTNDFVFWTFTNEDDFNENKAILESVL